MMEGEWKSAMRDEIELHEFCEIAGVRPGESCQMALRRAAHFRTAAALASAYACRRSYMPRKRSDDR